MPELWGKSADSVNRKLRELWVKDPNNVNQKLRELWAKDGGGVNRKIFSAGSKIEYYGTSGIVNNPAWSIDSDGALNAAFSWATDGSSGSGIIFKVTPPNPANISIVASDTSNVVTGSAIPFTANNDITIMLASSIVSSPVQNSKGMCYLIRRSDQPITQGMTFPSMQPSGTVYPLNCFYLYIFGNQSITNVSIKFPVGSIKQTDGTLLL